MRRITNVAGMLGMGDCIYQRAFIRELEGDVYLSTPWPQLYRDLPNVFPVEISTRLRTHTKNIISQPLETWREAPPSHKRIRVHYHTGDLALNKVSILQAMEGCFRVKAKVFDLPKFDRLPIKTPYVVIRPATIRKEWKNAARNPLDQYICEAAEILREFGFRTISVADLQAGEEWCAQLPQCDENFNKGELSFEKLLGLVQGAALVVGGIGWIVPAAIAAHVPLIGILGGNGVHNAPEKITGLPMDLRRARFIRPDNFCMCEDRAHECDKRISNFKLQFKQALGQICSNRSAAKI